MRISLALLLALMAAAAAGWMLGRADATSPPAAAESEADADKSVGSALSSAPTTDDTAAAATAQVPAAPTDQAPPASRPPSSSTSTGSRAPDGLPRVVFQVVDETEHAIADANVIAFDGERDLASALTDEQGEASLRAVPRDSAFRVRAAGYLPHIGRADPAREREVVVMHEAPRLRGRVFASGAFVAGATVALVPLVDGRRTAPAVLPPGCHTDTSDAVGEFVMHWPDLDEHDLVVTANGFAPWVMPRISFTAQGVAPVVVSLLPAARLEGEAVRASGEVLQGVLVEVWSAPAGGPRTDLVLGAPQPWRGGQALRTAKTDFAGHFVCEDLPPGPAWATLAGHVSGGARLVVLEAGGTRTITLAAPTMAAVFGRVAMGAPGADVFLQGNSLREVGAGVDGAFRFDQVPPGRYLIGLKQEPFAEHLHAVTQQFLLAGHSPHCLTIDLAAGELREIDLAPPQSATGIVSGQAFVDGTPAAGCSVAVESVAAIGAMRRQGEVQADGSFAVQGVLPGDYVVRLLATADRRVLTDAPCRVSAGNTTLLTLVAR